MKKYIVIIISLLVLSFPQSVFCSNVKGMDEYTDLTQSIYNAGQLYKLDMYTSDNVFYTLFNYDNIKSFINDVLSGEFSFDFKYFINNLKKMFFSSLKENMSLVFSFTALSILLSLINLLNTSFENKQISKVGFFCVYVAFASVVIKCFFEIVNIAYSLTNAITGYMNVLLPVIILLLNLSGNVITGNAISVSLVFIINFFASAMTYFIIPTLTFGFVLTVIDNIMVDINISYLISFIKQGVLFLIGIFSCLFLGILAIQGKLFSSIDTLSLKTAKYAISNLVPVLGSLISDSSDTVIGFIKVIKNSTGVLGIFILISLLLIPFFNIISTIIVLKISAFISQPITDGRISKSLNDACGFLSLIFACFLVVALLFVMLIGIISMIGG